MSLSRPVFMYERIPLAARLAAGPPIAPSINISTPSRFKSGEKMAIDYLFLDLEGVGPSVVVDPRDVTVRIEDNNNKSWMRYAVMLPNLNNVVRSRSDGKVNGDWRTQALAANTAWVLPAGTHNVMISTVFPQLQRNVAGWVGVGMPAGEIQSDGANVRILNPLGSPGCNILYQRTDSEDFGEWWLPRPFEIEKKHNFTLHIQNRQASPTKFILTFHAKGKLTKRPYVLQQEVEIAAATTQAFSGQGLQLNSEEPFFIYAMTFCKHPELLTALAAEYQFDSRLIDLQIVPSQGANWSEYRVPLVAYTNVHGKAVSAFFQPPKINDNDEGFILEQNDYLDFTLYNHSAAARFAHVAIAGHTIS